MSLPPDATAEKSKHGHADEGSHGEHSLLYDYREAELLQAHVSNFPKTATQVDVE